MKWFLSLVGGVPGGPWALLAAVVALGGLYATWRHSVYQEGYRSGEHNIQVQWDQERKSADLFQRQQETAYRGIIVRQNQATEEIVNALQKERDAAMDASRDTARRLSDAYRRLQASAVSSLACPALGPDGSPEVASNRGRIERRVEDHFAACAADRAALKGWQDWYSAIRKASIDQGKQGLVLPEAVPEKAGALGETGAQ